MAKNVESLMELIRAKKWEEYWEIVNTLRDNVEKLESAYAAHITGTPAETIAEFCANVGKERAVEIIATLINRHSWDGRISRANKEWAENFGYDCAAAEKMGIYTNAIHMAHLDQLASAMRKEA